jgi:4-hydroxybenzoate polyprenyltransferase
MLKTTRHLLELIRFSHTLFALPFALLSAVMAWRLNFIDEFIVPHQAAGKAKDETLPQLIDLWATGVVDQLRDRLDSPLIGVWYGFAIRWQEIVGILLCMVAARSFALAFNRLADRHIDATNPRTAGRHLPTGILGVTQVTAFAVLCAVGFIASTMLFLPNRLPLFLSIPVLLLLAGYSFTKRFTSLAHFWLGTSLALAPIATWIAIRGELVLAHPADLLPTIVLGGAVLTWVAGFDIIYACQDYDVDVAAGHHSIPARVGIAGALRLAAACHLATIALFASLPLVFPYFGWIYWLAVIAIAVLLIYEHLLVRPNDLSRVNAAFFNVNAIISIGLFAVGTLDLVLHRVG